MVVGGSDRQHVDLEYGIGQEVSQEEKLFSSRLALKLPSKVYCCKKRQTLIEDSITFPSIKDKKNIAKPCNKSFGNFKQEARWISQLRPDSYETVFIVILIVNFCSMATITFQDPLAKDKNTLRSIISACSMNFFLAVIVRNEAFINLLFWLAVSVPEPWPFWSRCLAGKVYVYGAVHTGCASAAVFWYFLFATVTAYEHTMNEGKTIARIATNWITVSIFLLIVLSACPLVRRSSHNIFEQIHRFAGWSSIFLLWIQLVLFEQEINSSSQTTTQQAILRSIPFWTVLLTTILVAYPWTRIRFRTVYPEKLSEHAVRLHFGYRITPVIGTSIKISRSPLREWHPFAIVPNPRDENAFSVIISKAGDWTNDFIDDPPLGIWVRETPVWGVLRVSTLFRPVVVLATGSGIAPCLSLFRREPSHPCHIVWSTRNPGETYGEEILKIVRTVDPQAVIINTSRARRPDLVKEAYTRYKEIGAEAVIVISNRKVTERTVAGLKNMGVPTHAPIFDS